jgi:dipeptidyl-peptidase-4
VEVAGGAARFLDLHGYSPDASLITHFVWQPDSRSALVYVQDRAQTWLDVLRWDTAKSDAQRLFRETTKAWVDNPGDPSFLADGSFLLTSERDGWRHLYHFAQDGSLTRQITSGPWEVRRLHAVVDDAVYVSGTRDSHLAENLYRIRLDGTEPQRITDANYHHELTLSPQGRLLIDTHSRFDQSIKVQLLTSDGRLVRTIDSNPIVDLGRVELPSLEWQSITMRDGFVLDATLIKPPGFDATRKYPVWLRTYGGPHAPTLGWGWQSGRVHERLLAQMGIIAFRFDPRSASGRGACSAWTAFRQLGVQETLDIEDAVDWLTRQSFVDPQRIGLSGHSYGGFLTAYVMTHSTKFAAGISGVPVTDWRNYDTIYTERYMDLPQNNPSGYARTSVVDAAGRLHGRLLLLHGARDDNVHIANSMQFARALQQADAQFELMVYPDNRHGISGPHYDRLVIDFIRRTMLGSDGSRPTVPTASAD